MSYRFEGGESRKGVAVFVSRYGHCLHDLLWRHRQGELPCDVRLVVANHPDHRDVAAQFGIPFHLIPVASGDKEPAEARAIALLEENAIDLVVFARYMQVRLPQPSSRAIPTASSTSTTRSCRRSSDRKPYHQAKERGVKLIGATAHYATADLDEGPIIEQDVARISHRDSVDDLLRKGRDLEKVVLARAVRQHLEDRILVFGNKTVVFD